MTAKQIILLRDPSVTDDARLTSLITLATSKTGDIFGTQKNDAIALQVLHWLALETLAPGGSSGGIKSESEGDLSKSYGTVGQSNNELSSTKWGAELLRLRNAVIFGARNRTIP